MLDILFRDARIVDGSGNPWFRGDVGVEAGQIASIGDLSGSSARLVVEAHDAYLTPGFIDVHTHSDFSLPAFPRAESLISQGITTEVVGNCGLTPHPVDPERIELIQKYTAFLGATMPWDWSSTAQFLEYMESLPLSHDVLSLVGHGSIRVAVMGFDNRAPTSSELDLMKRYVAEAMEAGAAGLSTGLIYAPGSFASSDELIELCSVVRRFRGIYTTHLRDESAGLMAAVEEALQIGKSAGVPVQFSHHKVMGEANWGLVRESLSRIDRARREGQDVTLDQYPYTGSSTTFSVFLPGWALEGGVAGLLERLGDNESRHRIAVAAQRMDWNQVLIAGLNRSEDKDYEGLSIHQLGAALAKDPFEAALDLILSEGGPFSIVRFGMAEQDVKYVMRHPHVMVASDGHAMSPKLGGKPHPRSYGTFPRVLGRYTDELGGLSLEESVRKMTSLPAQRFGLWDRGLIRPGQRADLNLLGPTISDTATFSEPHSYSRGVESVMVNGRLVWTGGSDTGARAGKIVRSGRP
ncbi:MAG: D-aminoacylase [Trueperaceae bacterium]